MFSNAERRWYNKNCQERTQVRTMSKNKKIFFLTSILTPCWFTISIIHVSKKESITNIMINPKRIGVVIVVYDNIIGFYIIRNLLLLVCVDE